MKYIFTVTVILACTLVILLLFTNNINPTSNRRQSSELHEQNKFLYLRHNVGFDEMVQKNRKFNITDQDLMVLLHIQKTGGTTFERHLVHDLIIPSPCDCNEDRKRCFCSRAVSKDSTKTIADSTWLISRFSTGWACGLHADWTQLNDCLRNIPKLFFITFLRHPLHRFISEFRHVQRGATWRTSKGHCALYNTQLCYNNQINWLNVSLEDFMDCPNNMAVNRQTRMLANYNLIGCPSNSVTNSVEHNDMMLASAIDNLKNIAFFGLCEEQELSQLIFEKTFNLKFKQNFRQSDDDKTKVLIEKLPSNIIARILRINHLDIKLYDYAKNLFRSRCEQLSSKCSRKNIKKS